MIFIQGKKHCSSLCTQNVSTRFLNSKKSAGSYKQVSFKKRVSLMQNFKFHDYDSKYETEREMTGNSEIEQPSTEYWRGHWGKFPQFSIVTYSKTWWGISPITCSEFSRLSKETEISQLWKQQENNHEHGMFLSTTGCTVDRIPQRHFLFPFVY